MASAEAREQPSVARGRHRAIGVAAALGCALPTLIYAAWSPAFVADDWQLAAGAEFHHWDPFTLQASRPISGAWYVLNFLVLGPHPVPHLVVLALLNALAGLLVWVTAARFLPLRTAVLATATWTVLANRGSTRFWPTVAPYVLVLAATLATLLLARSGTPSPRRHAAVVAIATATVVTYEGAAGLAVATVVVSAWRWTGRRRVVALLSGGVVMAGVAAWAVSQTPKSTGDLFSRPAQWISAQMGTGILPTALVPVGVALVGVITWAAATYVLPSFRPGDEERDVLRGVAIALLGAGPFLVTGFPVATDGIFDRANLYADVGTALVIAAALGMLWRIPVPRLGAVVTAAVLAVLAAQNATDMRGFHRSGEDGRQLLARVDRLPLATRTRGPVVVPELPNRAGVSMFVDDADLAAGLALRYDTGLPYPAASLVRSRQRTR